jgi:hypothetical protein
MELICLSVFAILGCLNLLYYIDTEVESSFIEAARNSWNLYPILNVSFTPAEGYEPYAIFDQKDIDTFCDCTYVGDYLKPSSGSCSESKIKDGCIEYKPKKAYIYERKVLYVKYYEANYYELFSRIFATNNSLCESGYKRCGYLDIFKNRFCVKESEKCPITKINIEYETFSNEGFDLNIVNRLYASENDKATILDINKIYTKRDLDEFTLSKTALYFNLSYTFNKMKKSEFLSKNELVIGTIPEKFDDAYFYLYNLVYPGNLKDYELNSFYVGLIHKRFVLLFLLLLVKIAFGVLLWLLNEKDKISKKMFYIIAILTACYLILMIFHILFLKGRFHLDKILSYYKEQKIYVTEEDWRDGTSLFVSGIIFSFIDFGYIFLGIVLIVNFRKNIKEEINEEIVQPLAISN